MGKEKKNENDGGRGVTMQKREIGGREGEPTRGERVWRAHLFPR